MPVAYHPKNLPFTTIITAPTYDGSEDSTLWKIQHMIPAPSVHTNDGATPRGADIAEQLYLAS